MRLLTINLFPILPTTTADICMLMNFDAELDSNYLFNEEFINWFIQLKTNVKIEENNIILFVPNNLKLIVQNVERNIFNLFFKYKEKLIIKYD
jgi:hypothetical protein